MLLVLTKQFITKSQYLHILFIERNFNTSTLSGVLAQAYARWDAFFLKLQWKSIAIFQEHVPKMNIGRNSPVITNLDTHAHTHTKRFPLYMIVSAL